MCVSRINILLSVFVLSIFGVSALNAQTVKKPDFAYPQTVSTQAAKALDTALARKDGPAIIRNLLDYYLAETAISTSRSTQGLSKMDSIAGMTANHVLKAMIRTLEADIYSSIYKSDKWKYDNRTLPLLPLPSDFNEWSGEQFRYKINLLLDSALSVDADLKLIPIKDYASVLSLGRTLSARNETQIYYPTLFDFIGHKAISLLSSTGDISNILSWGLLIRHDLYLQTPFNRFDPTASRILDIYTSLLKFHPAPSAPFVITEISRLDFITSHVWNSGDDTTLSPDRRHDELLKDLYEECKSSEYSGNILLAVNRHNSSIKKWLYGAINHNLKTFPAFSRNNNLKNALTEIGMQEIELSYPTIAAPGSDVKFSLTISNVKAGKLYIYNVSSTPVADQSYNCTGLPSMTPTAIIPFSTSSTVPFAEKQTLNYSFSTSGQYIAIATIDGAPRKNRQWYRKIYVTDYTLASSTYDRTKIWALRASDGAPVEDAKISIIPNTVSSNAYPQTLGSTSADGSLLCAKSGTILMAKGNDRFASPLWVYINNESRQQSPEWHQTASGYPALPLYHPGDSVEWMAVCYEYRAREHRPLISREVTAILRDSKYQPLDTLRLTTDPYGRVNGRFLLPKDALSGNFCISVDNNSDAVRFMVSDYKLPSFRLILDQPEKDYPAEGDVCLRGRVQTYAGFPVADAGITVNLSAMQPLRWWYRSNAVKFQIIEASTDATGEIKIVIPRQTLELSPIPGGLFSAEVTALSPSGESQRTSTVFSTGMRYAIRVSVPANVDISAPTPAIKAEVVDYRDSIVRIPVNFAIMRDSMKIFDGTLRPGQPIVNLTSIASGSYRLTFSIEDPALASPVSQDVVLYKPSDTATPAPDILLWYPASELKADALTGQAEWLYAVNCPTNLLITVHTSDSILSQSWVKADKGMNRLSLRIPDDIDSANANIAVTGNYHNAIASLTIRRDVVAKAIRFTAESFRDRTVPGSEESWTFRVTDESGKGRQTAVIMDMYNTALDALAKTDWNFHAATSWGGGHSFRWRQNELSASEYQSTYYSLGKALSQNQIIQPDFDTYGMPIFNRFSAMNGIRIRGSRSVKSAAYLSDVKEHAEEVTVEEEEVMDCGAVAPLRYSLAKKEAMLTGATADAESALDEIVVGSGEGSKAESPQEPTFTFRDREVPLSFFRPMLETDAEGHLSLKFTVPNANTTWGLRAIAFTDSLLSTSFAADILAAKPLMVQPNLPRFVRTGDRITIEASVMNADNKAQLIQTIIELFNPTNGTILTSHSHSDSIKTNSAVTVGIEFTAPTDVPFVGYRIKSSSDHFADGEQSLIPVLPAVTPVIDTYPFYLAPDQDKFSMSLPVTPQDARITLQYCDNPVWYVVTALPGLLDTEATTANEAGASIFSAAIATGLLRDNPAIADALREWTSSEKTDGMLTSMLQRNEDLKQILLAATPWMLDAKNDNERMTRLAILFDSNTVKNTISANITTLRKLQRNGGGWAWYSSSKEASAWVTENLLLLFGRLNELGFLPESGELRNMIVAAIRWIDSKTGREFSKYPNADYTSYVYMRGFYKNLKGAPAIDSKIVGKTVQRILADWKNASVFNKAIFARILAWNSYPSVAKQILASLREYAETSPEKGMWWPSLDNLTLWSMSKTGITAIILDAYSAIEPGCPEIDMIRQWLILQKEAKDWGTSVTTSSVIASILSTSRTWINPAGQSKILVGGHVVKPSETERLTGSMRSPVELRAGSKPELKITRSGSSPAWGAMYYLYTDSMTNVKAASSADLSINKELIVTGTTIASSADTLHVGQRISVTLTLKVGRDMDYVTVIDERPACFEPVEQLPKPIFSEGIYFYRENRDSSTRLFIDHLPKGTYVLTYDMWINNAGQFASGIATVQSQYAPQLSAHTSGLRLDVGSAE